MTEPLEGLVRVPGVPSAATWDPGLRRSTTNAAPADGPDASPPAAVRRAGPRGEDADESFEHFYATARPGIGRALAFTLRDTELAADAVDEAMARAYQRWDRVGGLENPGGWVYRVGLNYARSRLRRRRGREDLLHPASAHEPAPFEPSVVAAVLLLPKPQRAVVVCRFLLGWSEAQTADALHIRRGTVKSRQHRALAALQIQLAHLEEDKP
jgi:RNA polymerase sigma factor (sigma-70 family)